MIEIVKMRGEGLETVRKRYEEGWRVMWKDGEWCGRMGSGEEGWGVVVLRWCGRMGSGGIEVVRKDGKWCGRTPHPSAPHPILSHHSPSFLTSMPPLPILPHHLNATTPHPSSPPQCHHSPSHVPRHQIFRAHLAALSKNRVWTC